MRGTRVEQLRGGGAPRLVRVLTSRAAAAALVFAVLMAPVPAAGLAYGTVVGGLGRLAVAIGASSAVEVRFAPGGMEGADAATRNPWVLGIHVEDPDTGRYVGTALDLRRSGYIASAVFVALAVMTPLRGRRSRWKKAALLGAGLVGLQTLPLLPLLSFFSGKLPVTVFDLGPIPRALIEVSYHALVAPPGMAYAVPALVWLLLVTLIDPSCLPRPWAERRSSPVE